jgi:3-dehydroquinate synthetase
LENLELVEEFIQVKSMFLILQILFELKMPNAAKPILDLLEAKQKEIERVIEQKSMIKNQHSNSANDSTNSQPGEDTKSWTTNGSIYDALDESIINKNSFCIILGNFVRKSAVSPKTVNMCEF